MQQNDLVVFEIMTNLFSFVTLDKFTPVRNDLHFHTGIQMFSLLDFHRKMRHKKTICVVIGVFSPSAEVRLQLLSKMFQYRIRCHLYRMLPRSKFSLFVFEF